MARILGSIGSIYYYKCVYEEALIYLNKALNFQSKVAEANFDYNTLIYLNICKCLNKQYNLNQFDISIFLDSQDFEIQFLLYKLLDNNSHLKQAYSIIKENGIKKDDKNKYLNYPLPKLIIEEYNKVFKK